MLLLTTESDYSFAYSNSLSPSEVIQWNCY
jgi:hypothetical protein